MVFFNEGFPYKSNLTLRFPDVRVPEAGVEGVAEVWVLIVLAGQRLLPAAAHAQQLPLLAVTPLHSTVLKPNLDLVKIF